MDEPSLRDVIRRRIENPPTTSVLTQRLWQLLLDEPSLTAPIDSGAASVWERPMLLLAAVTELLRTSESGHPLAQYWPVLGGRRAPDAHGDAAFGELVSRRGEDLKRRCDTASVRSNDPHVAALLWPALVTLTGRRPLGLIELGGAAGLGLLPDRFGYRFGEGITVAADRPTVVECELRGRAPAELATIGPITARIGIELAPIRHHDTDAIAWLRNCVDIGSPSLLARMDAALAEPALAEIDWRGGDYFDELPTAIASLPAEALPVVYGAHTMCCAEDTHRLPELLSQAGRELWWLAIEGTGNALALVSEAAAEFDTVDKARQPVLLTATRFHHREPMEVHILAEVDPGHEWLDWNPRSVPPLA